MSASLLALFSPEAKRLADLRTLPFVVDCKPTPNDGSRRAFWRDASTGNGVEDELLGGAWARRYLEYAARDPSGSPHFPSIVRDMMRGGSFGAVEIGFLSTIEAAARARYREG